MRSRLVWDPAHIVYLENWYMKETRYPNLAQCQLYANTLSQVAHSGEYDERGALKRELLIRCLNTLDSNGKSRSSVSVTAQNVSHWFQNRRRKDTHPEIEEKRVKRSQTRKRAKTGPLDLTQQQPMPTVVETPLNMSTHEPVRNRYARDSDDEPGLCIADHSDHEMGPSTPNRR